MSLQLAIEMLHIVRYSQLIVAYCAVQLIDCIPEGKVRRRVEGLS